MSAVGSLVAILALIGLMRREYVDHFALLAGVLFASCPMLIFYGRAVIPDVWMLACMLASAYFFRVALGNNRCIAPVPLPGTSPPPKGAPMAMEGLWQPRQLLGNSMLRPFASGVAGLLAVAFKYYGLMVLLPMVEMAWRLQGRGEDWCGFACPPP